MATIHRTDVSLSRASSRDRVHDSVRTPSYWAAPQRALLLIHGYRTGLDRAETNYDTFQGLLDETLSADPRRVDLVALTWPGDKPVPLINGLYFAEAHGHATRCVEPVAEFLRGGGPGAPGGRSPSLRIRWAVTWPLRWRVHC